MFHHGRHNATVTTRPIIRSGNATKARGGDVTVDRCVRCMRQPSTSCMIGPGESSVLPAPRRPGGGSIERPLCEQDVSDSAEPQSACPLQMQQRHSTSRIHSAARLTAALLTECCYRRRFSLMVCVRKAVAGRHEPHSLSAKLNSDCNVHLFLVSQ